MPKNDLYVACDIEDCRKLNHKLKTAWSDKTPMKMNIICVTCTNANPGKTAYVAYGVQQNSFGQWRRRVDEREREREEETVIE